MFPLDPARALNVLSLVQYAFIEWSLIFYDTLYDACSFVDFARLELRVVEVGAGRPANAGYAKSSLPR